MSRGRMLLAARTNWLGGIEEPEKKLATNPRACVPESVRPLPAKETGPPVIFVKAADTNP